MSTSKYLQDAQAAIDFALKRCRRKHTSASHNIPHVRRTGSDEIHRETYELIARKLRLALDSLESR